MRCLGIPNTAHFANITSIEDALALWNKLKNNKDDERWKPDMEVSFINLNISKIIYLF
jgi:splicing factor 3A subunit 3